MTSMTGRTYLVKDLQSIWQLGVKIFFLIPLAFCKSGYSTVEGTSGKFLELLTLLLREVSFQHSLPGAPKVLDGLGAEIVQTQLQSGRGSFFCFWPFPTQAFFPLQ